MDQWTSIDFQGIISLDQKLIQQLKAYLDQKESFLAKSLVKSILQKDPDFFFSSAPFPLNKISKIFEDFPLLNADALKLNWIKVANELNSFLWQYTELLINCINELFQQLKQIDLKDWSPSLLHSLTKIKYLLMNRLEILIETLQFLEKKLQNYRSLSLHKSKAFLYKLFNYWLPIIDKDLVFKLINSQKFLSFQYTVFFNQFNSYIQLKTDIEKSVKKFSPYEVLQQLEIFHIQQITHLYEQIKLWDENLKLKHLPSIQVSTSLRLQFSPERVINLFKEYLEALNHKLFELSRKVKDNTLSLDSLEEDFQHLPSIQAEIHRFMALIAKYRLFLLKTDSNPYVRNRWGFSEWVTGPEPSQSKILLELEQEAEEIASLFKSFQESIQKLSSERSFIDLEEIRKEIQWNLHEIGQPLSSSHTIKIHTEKILTLLYELDELGTSHSEVVLLTSQTLSTLLRLDWKYNVLFQTSAFEPLYHLHLNIVAPIPHRAHLNRLNKFKALTDQIYNWIKTYNDQGHIQEIESDMNDIKEYLQDFLANIQRYLHRNSFEKDILFIHNVRQELLEYRYLFAHFFHLLRQSNPNERVLRQQFLFVDQYFETIESLLAHD